MILRRLALVVAVLSVESLNASPVEIAAGGFSVQTPSEPRLTGRELAPNAPPNALFPRIHGKHFFLDSVTWGKSPEGESLSSVLKRRGETSGFSYSKVEPFTTNAGVTGIRFLFRPREPVKQITLHRFVFKNRAGEIICIGSYGAVPDVEALLASVSLLN